MDDPRKALFPDVHNAVEAPFWAGTRAGEIRLPQCMACRTLRWPATRHCTECLSTAVTWKPVPSTGSLWSFTIYRRAMNPAFRERVPYAAGLIELDAGIHMIGALDVEFDQLRIGMSLAVGFETIDDELTLPVWKPL